LRKNHALPLVSIVVLNYRNPPLTARCVETALTSALEAKTSVEVIVVDNSAPQTASALHRLLPAEAKIIENAQNQGFAKASNQGIKTSKGQFVLLLNNDCFINPGCLDMGLRYLEDHANAGVWAPRLTDETGQPQVSCSRTHSLKGLASEYLLRRASDRYQDVFEWTQPTEVESVIGAFFLLPRRTLDRIGLLDEDYFFNVEDVDYCRRAAKAGLSVIYDPRASAVHLSRASQEEVHFVRDAHLHRNRVLYVRKHRGKASAYVASAIIALGLAARRAKLCLKSAFQ